jgi:hypothetical protein
MDKFYTNLYFFSNKIVRFSLVKRPVDSTFIAINAALCYITLCHTIAYRLSPKITK